MNALNPSTNSGSTSRSRAAAQWEKVPGSEALGPRIAIVLMVVWIALAAFPPVPSGLGSGLDASWGYALNLAHSQHLVFGRDIVFTFGPLGYISCPDFELAEPNAVLLFWTFAYVLFVWGIIRCWTNLPRSVALVCSLPLTAMMLVSNAPFERIQIAFLAMAIAAAGTTRFQIFDYVLLGITTGATFLIKLNDGITSGAIFYCLLLARYHYARKHIRRVHILPLLALCPIAVAWAGLIVLQGNPISIFAYARNSWDIIAGYSEAMSSTGPMWQFGLGLLSILALFVAIPWILERPASLLRNVLPALLFAFFSFKHAMVRQDSHAEAFQMKLALAALFFLACAETARDRKVLSAFALLSMAMGLFVVVSSAPNLASAALDRAELIPLKKNLDAFLDWDTTWKALRANDRAALQANQVEPQIAAAIRGKAVDSYPNRIDLVKSGNWKWRGRPIMQSYSAYTPRLDQMNAVHLSKRSAAEEILMRFESIDGRHPFLDDAASWRALFNWYDLEVAGAETYLLRHRQSPRFSDLQELGSVEAKWGVDIPVPAVAPNQFLVMKADLPKSVWGRIRGTLFRVDPVFLEATYASSRKVSGRAVIANLADGAWISDLPQRIGETRPFFGNLPAGMRDRITSVRFTAAVASEFSSQIRISWSIVSFRPGELATAVTEPPHLTLTALWKPGQPPVWQAGTDVVNRPDLLAILPTRTDPMLFFETHQHLAKYKVVVVRARFSRAGTINAFFGRQSEGRGLEGDLPAANQWFDIYLNFASNAFWAKEAGSILRFDPPDTSVGDEIQIAGIWGSPDQGNLPKDQQMIFFPVQVNGAEWSTSRTSSLPPIPGTTPAYIDQINEIKQLDSGTVVLGKATSLSISGWAVDGNSHMPAGGVTVAIDGTQTQARYGLSRPDVGRVLDNPRYDNSGFQLEIPTSGIGPGDHHLELRVLNSGRTGYYLARTLTIRIP